MKKWNPDVEKGKGSRSLTAIITDVHYRMSLALIRDLAEAGVRLICCEREGMASPLGFRSRHVRESVLLPAKEFLRSEERRVGKECL